MKGKIIEINGLDCSFKETNTKKLEEYIKNNITINRLRDTYQQVLRYKENLLKKNPHIIIVFVLEKYTDAVSKNIKEYYIIK